MDSPQSQPAPPQSAADAYEPPAILWEQPLVALTQISDPDCNPCGPEPCPVVC